MCKPIVNRCANTKPVAKAICHLCKEEMVLVHKSDFDALMRCWLQTLQEKAS